MWGGALALLVTLALFFDAKAVGIALFSVGLLLLGGGRALRAAFRHLRVSRPAGRTYLFPGETAEVSIRFENPTYIPLTWLTGFDRLPPRLTGVRLKRWVVSVPPRSAATVTYRLKPAQRGVYTVGPIEMEVGDPLGLHRCTGTSQCLHDIVVYPEVFPLPQLGLASNLPLGNVRSARRIHPDPNRLAGVRPYQPGDPAQWIHWKATARAGRTHVKQFEHTLTLDTFIVLNFNEPDYKWGVRWHDAELAVSVAASLANHVMQLGESFGFVTNAHLHYYSAIADVRAGEAGAEHVVRLMPRKGSGQLMRVLEILAAAVCEPCTDFVAMLSSESRHFGWGATLMLVTPVDTDDVVRTGALLAASGYRVMLFVTGEQVIHRHLVHHSPYRGFKVLHVRRGRGAPLVVEGGEEAG